MPTAADTPIKHSDHLLLEQQLIRLPYELSRKTFRSVHRIIEKESTAIQTASKNAANSALKKSMTGQAAVKELDSMIKQVQALKNKLSSHVAEEVKQNRRIETRLDHVNELYQIPYFEDPSYELWSRTRLDRLMVDYMLQAGFPKSAQLLASERGIEDLVDIEPFVQWNKIRTGLLNHKVTDALAWCAENKKELRKIDCNLEFMLRYQQFIELLRDGNRLEAAIKHIRKHLLPLQETYPKEVSQACGLIAFSPSISTFHLWSADRWTSLSQIFTTAFHQLFAIHPQPLLLVTLRTGISALKTPACRTHAPIFPSTQTSESSQPSIATTIDAAMAASDSVDDQTTNNDPESDHDHDPDSPMADATTIAHTHSLPHFHSYSHPEIDPDDSYDPDDLDDPDAITPAPAPAPAPAPTRSFIPTVEPRTNLCPICSPELNELASPMPYACHTRSCMETDVVLLPSGNVYTRQALAEYADKAAVPAGQVQDLRTGEVYSLHEQKKIYIT